MMTKAQPMVSATVPASRIWRLVDRAVTLALEVSLASGKNRPRPKLVPRATKLRIGTITQEAEGVVSLTLHSTNDTALAPWQPGAHLDITLPSGRKRQYSLCGDPSDRRHYRIAVRLIAAGKGGSRELHALREGEVLEVSEPRNAFPFIDAPSYFFLAGGIGITPVLPMVREAAARGSDWSIVYAGRSRASMPFLAELDALASAHPGRVHVWTEDEAGAPNPAHWLAHAPRNAIAYVCGPAPLLAAVQSSLLDARVNVNANVNVKALHFERFAAAPIVAGTAFELVLARSGLTLPVAADESALDALLRRLPHAAHSCRQGFCGTCKVRTLTGAVEHRDELLTPAQRRDTMLLCVSRAAAAGGRIVIDM